MQVKFPQRFLLFGSALVITVISSFKNSSLAKPPEVKSSPGDGSDYEKKEVSKNDEFEFTALTPNESIVLPKEGKHVPINIGFRITNKSSYAKRFLAYQIRPVFLDGKQQIIPPPLACARPRSSLTGLSPKLLKPGESLIIPGQTSFLYRKQGKFSMMYNTNDEETCEFRGFSAGKYSVLIDYETPPSYFHLPAEDEENLWVGHIRSKSGSLIFVEKS
jgi:hypothetical protein